MGWYPIHTVGLLCTNEQKVHVHINCLFSKTKKSGTFLTWTLKGQRWAPVLWRCRYCRGTLLFSFRPSDLFIIANCPPCKSVKCDDPGEYGPQKDCLWWLTFWQPDDFRSGCRNICQCHHKQSFSGLHSPAWSHFTDLWYDSWVQIIYGVYRGRVHVKIYFLLDQANYA